MVLLAVNCVHWAQPTVRCHPRVALVVVPLDHHGQLVINHVEVTDSVVSHLQHILQGAVALRPGTMQAHMLFMSHATAWLALPESVTPALQKPAGPPQAL